MNTIPFADKTIRECFHIMHGIRWRDFEVYDRYQWYYAENLTYLVQDKWTGAVWCVFAENPMNALCVVLEKILEAAKKEI